MTNIFADTSAAIAEDPGEEFTESLEVEEDMEDSKMNFTAVVNAVKMATQEAISRQTIQAYTRYHHLFRCNVHGKYNTDSV